jgi:putative toxin-antitoxin system antitoxin component (TIGR02293 family)
MPYGTNRNFTMSATLSLEKMLGGQRSLPPPPLTPLQWVSVIRQGIPSVAVDALTQAMRITQAELAAALAIPDRTLARRKREGRFNSEETAKLVRLARVIARAEETFEDLDAARDWLKSANAALAGATPLSLLDTDIGAESVLDTLGRIEHGVFA